MTEEKPPVEERSGAACCEISEIMQRMFRAFGPSSEARVHFRQARVEFLKGIRKVVDDKIERASRDPHQKGSRIVVE